MAKQFCRTLGIILLIIGFLGYIPGLAPDGHLFGIFMVDAVHNMIHVLSGLILVGVGYSGTEHTARNTSLAFGIVYGLVTLLGFIGGGTVLGLIMVNMADNILHLLISVSALAVGLRRERIVSVR